MDQIVLKFRTHMLQLFEEVSLKVSLSVLRQFLTNRKSFKNDEKGFLFHDKSAIHSGDIYIFALAFWLCRKTP